MLTKERKNWNVKSSEIDNKIVNEIESALGVSAILLLPLIAIAREVGEQLAQILLRKSQQV